CARWGYPYWYFDVW
nr:immunoglobulin heavy chain junction region [Mus musculus]